MFWSSVSMALFAIAAAVMCGFAVHEASGVSASDGWLAVGAFCAVFLVGIWNALRPVASDESRNRIGRAGNAAFIPLIVCTVALQPILPDALQPIILAAGGGAFTSLAALSGLGLARDIAGKAETRG